MSMGDGKQPLSRFRSWLAHSRKTRATRSDLPNTLPNTSQSAARHTSNKTRISPNQSITTTRKPASPSAQRTSSRPPGKATQTSNPQLQSLKSDSSLPLQARTPAESPIGQQGSQSSVDTQSSAISTSAATSQSRDDPQPPTTSRSAGHKTSPSAASIKLVQNLSSSSRDQMHIMDKQEAVCIKMLSSSEAITPQSMNNSPIGGSHEKPSTSKGEGITFHKEIKDNISMSLGRKKAYGDAKFFTDERPITVITIAGENRGASMQLSSGSPNIGRSLYIHRRYKFNHDENTETTTDGEEISKQTYSKDLETIEEDPEAATYINSNVQGINNSILFRRTIRQRNPGVHLVQTHKTTESIHSTDEKESSALKDEFNMTPSKKLAYKQPIVRRRCLRGLLLESSDSNPETPPEKARRHGCRVGCSERYQR